MFAEDVPVLAGDLLAIYCTILKSIEVGLTHKEKSANTKAEIVEAFIAQEVSSFQPRYFAIVRLFFNGDLSGLLKVNPGDASFNRRHLIGSAFDFYLSTFHEHVLGMSSPPDAYLSIFCTADRALSRYAGRFPLRAVSVLASGQLRIYHDWDDDWLTQLLGEPLFKKLQANIESHLSHGPNEKSPDEIIATTRALEATLNIAGDESIFKSF
jgi:hypothetical protein